MGAYEWGLLAQIRVFLQGDYDPLHDRMRTALTLPPMSPYADDLRLATVVPSNTVDWVLVQQHSTNDAVLTSQSALLLNDGRIVEPNGTEVTLRIGERTLLRDRSSGGSFLSAHDPRLHFGLGQADHVDLLEVRWPDGSRTELRDLAVDQRVTVRK